MCDAYLADVHKPILHLIAAETSLSWEVYFVYVLKVWVVKVVE